MAQVLKEIKIKNSFREFSNKEFNDLIMDYYRNCISCLNADETFKQLNIEINKKFENSFKDLLYQVSNPHSEINTYDSLDSERKSLKLITVALISILLRVGYNITNNNFSRSKFVEILRIKANKLSGYRSYIIRNFLEVNELEYYSKILNYYLEYIEKIDEFYNLHLDLEFKTIILKSKIEYLLNHLIKNRIRIPHRTFEKLCTNQQENGKILERYGLNIKILFKQNRYKFFMPQYIALLLIYFHKDITQIKEKKNLNINKIVKLFDIPHYTIITLYNLVKFTVQNTLNIKISQRRKYTRELFLTDLKKNLRRRYNLDFDLIYKLYALTDLNPDTFAKKIITHSGVKGAHTLINMMNRYSFSPNTYLRIKRNFIRLHDKNVISNSSLKKALRLLEKVSYIKSVSLTHGSLVFNFRINERNLRNIQDCKLRKKLTVYVEEITQGKHPKYIFDDPNVPSGSILYLKGNVEEKLSTYTIKTKLLKELQAKGKVKRHHSGLLFDFSMIAKDVYHEYNNKFGTFPNHDPILTSLLRRGKNIIGIEIPVWKTLTNHSYYTGHIDVLAVIDGTLVVADYKPDETEIIKSLPQICAYAYMLKQRLGLIDFNKIMCVGFSKDVVWSFHPQILERELLNFITEMNAKRNFPL